MRTFLGIPIAPDGTWLAGMGVARRLVGSLLAGALIASVAVLVVTLAWAAWAHRGGQNVFTRTVVTTLIGAVVLGSLSGMVAWGMGYFHFT